MSWRPIDFQGIIELDRKIINQLEQFLNEKESRLGRQILNSIKSISSEAFAPQLPESQMLRFSEAVEQFVKTLRQWDKDPLVRKSLLQQFIQEINRSLWEYTEVLEGSVVELFQQVKEVPINRWHLTIAPVVQSVKELLFRRIDDFIWNIKRLEESIEDYYQKYQKKWKWLQWSFFAGETLLDPNLTSNLKQTQKFLNSQYEKFHKRYHEYLFLSEKVEEYLEKMKTYPVLALLEISDQNLYVDVFRLLKMLELNRQFKTGVTGAVTQALKQLTSIEHVVKVFLSYLKELTDAFFNSSLEWKSLNQGTEDFKAIQEKMERKLKEYQHELRQLMHTMSRYRNFILKTDPNPYIRARLGFTEWIVGPQPTKAKKLQNLVYSAEELDSNFAQFIESLARDPFTQQSIEYQAHQEIDTLLHEMGQPLISHSVMRNRIERLLQRLKECDEIGSPQMSTIYYFEDVLSKAMRLDWKYHILQEFPLFHQIYRTHLGLCEYFEDPGHAFRLDRFNLLFDEIEEWLEKEALPSHAHEIELDLNDMKTYLQDFLATIQRVAKEKGTDPFLDETIHKFRQQLLEYRYLFGQFFSNVMSKNQEGRQLRNRFLFVDHYFESIENLLNELKESWEGKSL